MIKLIHGNLPIVEPKGTENFSLADRVLFLHVYAVRIFGTPDIRESLRFHLRQVFHCVISGFRSCVTEISTVLELYVAENPKRARISGFPLSPCSV